MPCRWWGVTFAPIPERVRYCPNRAKLYPSGGCKIYFSLSVVLCCAGGIVVYICPVFQRRGTLKPNTMGRYYKHNWAGKPNKPVRHEAMMAAKPKHVRMIKYETWTYQCNTGVLTVEFGGRFKMRCIVFGKQANQWATEVFFTNDCPDGQNVTCSIKGDYRSIREYCWADSTGPKVGHYMVKDDTKHGGVRVVDIHVNECLTVEEYELIRETIAWTWNAIDSGEFQFPQGHAYNQVALKTA